MNTNIFLELFNHLHHISASGWLLITLIFALSLGFFISAYRSFKRRKIR